MIVEKYTMLDGIHRHQREKKLVHLFTVPANIADMNTEFDATTPNLGWT